MRFFFLLSLILVSLPLWGQTKISTKHLKIIDASQHKWSPGTVQKNSEPAGGIIYETKIKVKKSGDLKIDHFIIEDKLLKVEINKGTERKVSGPFTKGDELTILARSETSSPISENLSASIGAKKKSAWLMYTVDGKNYLAGVSRINQKTVPTGSH